MDAQPSTSKGDVFLTPKIKRPRTALSVAEKLMVMNVYNYVYKEKSAQNDKNLDITTKTEVVAKAAEILGISIRTIYTVLKEHKENRTSIPKPPKKTGPKYTFKEKLDEFTFTAIRQTVQEFFYRNEPPTIAKVLQTVNNDPDLPNFSKETLRKILKHLNFEYITLSHQRVLIDRKDIIS